MTPERYMELRALAVRLIASCDGGRDDIETVADLQIEEAMVLDTMVLECVECGQWYEASEMKDRGHEFVCEGCDE